MYAKEALVRCFQGVGSRSAIIPCYCSGPITVPSSFFCSSLCRLPLVMINRLPFGNWTILASSSLSDFALYCAISKFSFSPCL